MRAARYYRDEEVYRVSFSQAIDAGSLSGDNVRVAFASGDFPAVRFDYTDGAAHELVFELDEGRSETGPARLLLRTGIMATDGTPVAEDAEGILIEERR